MNKEEILARSQRENRGQDIAEAEIVKSGAQIAWVIATCLASAACVVDAIVFSRACYEILFVLCAGSATEFAYKYRICKRKHELLVMICYLLASAAFMALWIAQIVRR
ncbi:MAG: hypothetical protein IJV43_04435 [Oscillospiraceae bacterium]|nr:hypothetical protein [Oscillospiraceae bacterium]